MSIRQLRLPAVLRENPNRMLPIRWTDPVTEGLVFFCYPVAGGFYEAVSGQFIAAPATGSTTMLTSIDGDQGCSMHAKNSATLTFARQTGMDKIAGPCTLYAEASAGAASLSGDFFKSYEAGSGNGVGMRFDDGATAYDSFNIFSGNSTNSQAYQGGSPNRALVGGPVANDNAYKFTHRMILTLDSAGGIKWYAKRKLKQTSAWGTSRQPGTHANRRTSITMNANHKIGVAAAFTGVRSVEQMNAFYDNHWRALEAPARLFPLSVPGGDASGVIGTTALGTMAMGASVDITGTAASGTVGSVSGSQPGLAEAAGFVATGAAGTTGANVSVAIAGQAATATIGSAVPALSSVPVGNYAGTNGRVVISWGSAGTYYEPADGVGSASFLTPNGTHMWANDTVVTTDGTTYAKLTQQGYEFSTGTSGGQSGFALPCGVCLPAEIIGSITGTVLSVTNVLVDQYVVINQIINSPFVAPGTVITSNGTTSGKAGDYNVNISQTVPSGKMSLSRRNGGKAYRGQYWTATGKGGVGDAGVFSDASDAYTATGSGIVIINKTGGGRFDMLSIDLAPNPNFGNQGLSASTPTSTSKVQFKGYDGATEVATYLATITYPSNPDDQVFSTVTLPATFTNLTSVKMYDAGYANGIIVGGSPSNAPYYMFSYVVLQPTAVSIGHESSVGTAGVAATGASAGVGQTGADATPVALLGTAASTAVGYLFPQISMVASGAAAVTATGSYAVSSSTGTTGVSAATFLGYAQPTVSPSISGIYTSTSAGSVSPALSAAITGNSGSTSVGVFSKVLSLAATGNIAITAIGASGVGGTPPVSQAVTGNAAAGSVGSLTYVAIPDGVFATRAVLTLANRVNVVAASINGIKVAYFDQSSPNALLAPRLVAEVNSDTNGEVSLNIDGLTALLPGQYGFVVMTNADGTISACGKVQVT